MKSVKHDTTPVVWPNTKMFVLSDSNCLSVPLADISPAFVIFDVERFTFFHLLILLSLHFISIYSLCPSLHFLFPGLSYCTFLSTVLFSKAQIFHPPLS